MIQITDHLHEVRERVEKAAAQAGRSAEEITLVAVSKGQPVAAIEAAYAAGQRDFGENFVQEAAAKIEALELPGICWHFIGRIQANKTKAIARLFDWVHTVDRVKIATRLDDQRPHYAAPLEVCLQVNLAEEPQKGGAAVADLAELAATVAACRRLHLRGLMTIPPADADAQRTAALYDELRRIEERMTAEGLELDTLSIGMSADLETAVRCGSTLLRVGTAIFGPRS